MAPLPQSRGEGFTACLDGTHRGGDVEGGAHVSRVGGRGAREARICLGCPQRLLVLELTVGGWDHVTPTCKQHDQCGKGAADGGGNAGSPRGCGQGRTAELRGGIRRG